MRRIHRNTELERRIQERMETRLSARYERTLRSELRSAANDAAAEYARSGILESAVRVHDKAVERALMAMYESAFLMTGDRMLDAIQDATGKSYRRHETKDAADVYQAALTSFVRRWTARKVVQISSTTVKLLSGVVESGIEQGLSVIEIGKLIRQKGSEFAGYRANLIARTEIHSAAQAGSLAAAQSSEQVIMKEWIHVQDDRVRDGDNDDFDHTRVEPVPKNEPFIVDGEELMHPGDPRGSAGNIINCRCAMTYMV